MKRNEINENETKRSETKRNQQKRNETKRNQRNENDTLLILYVYTKCLLEKIPSLIHKIISLFKTHKGNEGENKSTLSIYRPRIDSDKGTAPCSGCQLPEKRKNKFQ
jgi:hypothetical protein